MLLFAPAAEQAFQILGVFEFFGNNRGRIRVMDNVLTKEFIVFDDVPDYAAEERNVRSSADWDMNVGDSARSGKSWVYMNDRRAARLRLHHPSEPNRMAFRHVGAL